MRPQLVEVMHGVDEPDRARLRSHDQRLGGGSSRVDVHPLEQFAVGDAGRSEEAVVASAPGRRCPDARSRSYPAATAAARSSSSRGQRRPCSSPPMHFRAAAAMTPSGVPPMPKRTSAPESGHAVEMAPATSPSGMSRMRAPASRTSAIRSSWRSRSRITTVISEMSTRLVRATATEVLAGAQGDVDHPDQIRADGDLLHVDARSGIEHGALLGQRRCTASALPRPLRGQRGAVDRVDGDVDGGRRPVADPLAVVQASALRPSRPHRSRRRRPWARVPRTRRMASTAAPSAPSLSPRPIQRAAASAAASVTRTRSRATLRSGVSRTSVISRDYFRAAVVFPCELRSGS